MGMMLVPCEERHTDALAELLSEEAAAAYFSAAGLIDAAYVERVITGRDAECRLYAIADYVISDDSGDAVYGRVTALPADDPCAAELSYIVAAAFAGCGIATAAVRELLRRLSRLGLSRAEAKVAEWNTASIAVLRKNMFIEKERSIHPVHGPVVSMVRPLG